MPEERRLPANKDIRDTMKSKKLFTQAKEGGLKTVPDAPDKVKTRRTLNDRD